MIQNASPFNSLIDLDHANFPEFRSRNNNTQNSRTQSRSLANLDQKVNCEYCSESCFAHFYTDHKRICSRNPVNLGNIIEFYRNRNQTATTNNRNHNPQNSTAQTTRDQNTAGLSKTLCDFCNQPCYLAFQNDHKRVCAKNPENIKIGCNICKKTLGFFEYHNHLTNCAGNGPTVDLRPQSLNLDVHHGIEEDEKTRQVKTLQNLDRNENKENEPTQNRPEMECPICIEEIRGFFEMKALDCCHKFHKSCIDKWAKRQKQCPICRHKFI